MAEHKFDRMAINAAIEYLISEENDQWLEAAQQVIDFGVQIPSSGLTFWEVIDVEEGSDKKVSGYVAGIGDVEVSEQSGKPEIKHHFSGTVERVGYYRLFHLGPARSIKIQHYLKSGPFAVTSENTEEEHGGHFLVYNKDRTPGLFLEGSWKHAPPPIRVAIRLALYGFWRQTLLWIKTGGRSKMRVQQGYSKMVFRVVHSARTDFLSGSSVDHIPQPDL
jgi:hypothetical protein